MAPWVGSPASQERPAQALQPVEQGWFDRLLERLL
jgi:hypothetical protein